MDVALRFVFEMLILVICSLSPGLILVRRLRLGPLESLCVAIGLSWIVIYLAATGIYLAHLGAAWHFALTGACALGVIFSIPPIIRRRGRRYGQVSRLGGTPRNRQTPSLPN